MRATNDSVRDPFVAISPSFPLQPMPFNIAQELSLAMASNAAPPTVVRPTAPRQTARTRTQANTPRLALGLTKTASMRSQAQPRAPIMKPSPAEEELVCRIHRKVGGPSKLSTYDDPAKVRHVVIEALALEQTNLSDAGRIRKGQLTVFERRVVRTVTNRGAAVRSRMRQRREVAQLKYELRARDVRVRQLEEMVKGLCLKYSAPLPDGLFGKSVTVVERTQANDAETEAETDSMNSFGRTGTEVTSESGMDASVFAFDQQVFGNLMEQMISQSPWT